MSQNTRNVAIEMPNKVKGRADSTGSMPNAVRTEFCQSAAHHRKRTAMARHRAAVTMVAIERVRRASSGNSR